MRPGFKEAPVNPLPPVVWLILLPIVAMEVVLSAGSLGLAGGQAGIGWRADALQRFALSPLMLDQMVTSGRVVPDYLMRFVSYAIVHGNLTHAVFASVFVLALGKFVGEVFQGWAVLVVFLGAVIAGGLAYSLVPGLRIALYGAYPGAYGLIGAFTYILWARLGAAHAHRGRAFSLIGFLLGIQLLFGALFGGAPDWIADLTGFGAGFLLSFVVAPGGPAHLLRRMRQR